MKKAFAVILAMSMLCIMAVGTTLTYFTDEEFNGNIMTVGKVEIEQYEKDRDGNLINSTELKLYPVTANQDTTSGLVPVANNGVDKFVTVKNVGSELAYVRTVFAFEMKKVGDEWVNPIGTDVILVDNGITILNNVTFTKDGVQYVVGVYTYTDPLAKTATTAPSLKQVYLASNVGNDFSTAIGGEYTILVLSQAVQTQGFGSAQVALDTAFGEVNSANAATWFN